ncbi:MAG TPA: PIG-L deacetylase family protein [Spirochaetia bacterium]|nr:PIG-L deacetylase family protein [Spirochaetia bacterium]
MGTVVFAVSAHPDDIEWAMGGTMLLLREQGCTLHYMTIANGCYGTEVLSLQEITEVRRHEAMSAAEFLGAEFHESIANDFEIFYTNDLIRKVSATIRLVAPDILLTHALEDYMEDHMNAARLASSAAFVRSSVNYITIPPVPPIQKEVCVYHALPHGLTDRMRNPVAAETYVNIETVMEQKRRAISFHESQVAWLGSTQGTSTLAKAVEDDARLVGTASGRFEFAEGWNRHLHVGYSASEIDPLAELLSAYL